jgi:DNA-binding Lrp family transcriptional regulator
MDTRELLKLLGLSKKEEKVLAALQSGADTPLLLARATRVSRTAVYAILQNLKKRGLTHTHIMSGKKHWGLASEREIEETLYAAKRALLKIPAGREEVHGLSDSTVIIHRGAEAIKKLIHGILADNKNQRFYGFQGDAAAINWNKTFTLEDTNRFNRAIKENSIIVDAILPDGWFERQTRELGVGWAKDFEGRTTRVNIIDQEYFRHGGQVFIFKQSIYLMALGEEIVIEIRNSEIQKMLLSFFKFIEDNSRVIDANELLRGLIAEGERKSELNE